MKTPKSILVPTDMSTYSLAAVQYAEEVAKLFDAGLTVLYVIEKVEHGKHKEERTLQVDEEAVRQARSAVSRLLIDYNLVSQSIRIQIRHGSPAREIVRMANEMRADLIVMSTHGRTGIRRALLGGVAEKVVREAFCPVLTVKPEEFREMVDLTEEEVADSLHFVGWNEKQE